MLVLVRHAMPVVEPLTLPDRWVLSNEGKAAAAKLVLPQGARLVASGEPKAIQTLAHAGEVTSDTRFNEVRRVEPFSDDFREIRRAYVEGENHPDWELREEVVARFDEGIAAYPQRPLVVASHGMAMTLWLTARIGLAEPGEFWAGLRFPDALAIDPEKRAWTRLDLRH
jgi:broad specificity phosphatase PhoE